MPPAPRAPKAKRSSKPEAAATPAESAFRVGVRCRPLLPHERTLQAESVLTFAPGAVTLAAPDDAGMTSPDLFGGADGAGVAEYGDAVPPGKPAQRFSATTTHVPISPATASPPDLALPTPPRPPVAVLEDAGMTSPDPGRETSAPPLAGIFGPKLDESYEASQSYEASRIPSRDPLPSLKVLRDWGFQKLLEKCDLCVALPACTLAARQPH